MATQVTVVPGPPVPRPAPDPALDDALVRVRDLSVRLWAVRGEHPRAQDLLGRPRCRTCRSPWPCPTVRLAAP